MSKRIVLTDLVLLHNIIYGHSPLSLPSYLSFFSGQSRLRFSKLDKLSLVSSIIPSTKASKATCNNTFASSFFYRSHILWNDLPIEIRAISCPFKFKATVKSFLWTKLAEVPATYDDDEWEITLIRLLLTTISIYTSLAYLISITPHYF